MCKFKGTKSRHPLLGKCRAGLKMGVAAVVMAWGTVVLATPPLPSSAPLSLSQDLRDSITQSGLEARLLDLEAISLAAPGLNQANGTPGFEMGRDYVMQTLQNAGYSPTLLESTFLYERLNSLPLFEDLSSPNSYQFLSDFYVATYSGSNNVTANVEAVDVVVPIGSNPSNTSTSGCEASDFAGFTVGNIALIQRGSCAFRTKALNAQNAGASGVIIFNEGQPTRQDPVATTLQTTDFTIPVVGTSYAIGENLVLASNVSPVLVQLAVDATFQERPTWSIFADTPTGDKTRVVLISSHLGTGEAPGFAGTAPHVGEGYIGANGMSGMAANLEIAVKIQELGIKPKNKIRFAFWGQDGVDAYLGQKGNDDIAQTAVLLHTGGIGAKNFVRYVLDGDGSDFPADGIPNQSDLVEQVFLNYFDDVGIPVSPYIIGTESPRYDFIEAKNNHVPIGGVGTGDNQIKTPDEALIYGGTAGEPQDPCSAVLLTDTVCDTVANNVDLGVMEEMADAMAHAIRTFSEMP